jgi:hypothetical protein
VERWNRLAAGVLIVTGIAPCRVAAAADGIQPSIAVVVYDLAAVAEKVLERARADVALILARASVNATWVEPSAAESIHGRFVVRMIIRRNAADATQPVMAIAIEASSGCGGSAFVYFAKVVESADTGGQDVGRMLAYTIAHEIGHLLLPGGGHSPSGIMRAQWDSDDVRRIAGGSLRFTSEQTSAIRVRSAVCDTTR